MKNFFDYVENHAWAQWVTAAVTVGAFWAIAEIGFALIHG
jgi:hypothetical protein